MSAKFSGLLPQFQPGGGMDPKWMEGTRRLLTVCKSVAPEIVIDLFIYYDALKAKLALGVVPVSDLLDACMALTERGQGEPDAARLAYLDAAEMLSTLVSRARR